MKKTEGTPEGNIGLQQPVVIRRAVKEDAGMLIAFNQALAFETEDHVLPVENITPGVHKIFENPALGFYVVAQQGDTVVGCLLITTEWSDWRNATFWWIQSVYIIKETRRQGIYRQLYEFVQNLARQDASVCGFRLYVDHGNTPAQQTYEALGMQKSRYYMFEDLK